MNLLNTEEFYNLLNASNKIENRIINFQTIDLKHAELPVIFSNCNITGNFKIYNSSIASTLSNTKKSISFIDCKFNNCKFNNSDLGELKIENSIFTNDFSILNSTILSLEISNCNDITSKFTISFSKFKDLFFFSNNTFKETAKMFVFNNEFSSRTAFINNTINDSVFSVNTFSNFSEFTDNILSKSCKFESCNFKKLEFSISDISNLKFTFCSFLDTTTFNDLRRIEQSKVEFLRCEFKELTSFDNSRIGTLDINRCNLEKSTSFFNTEFDTIKLFEVKFGDGAYFDEMKINKVIDKSYLKDKSKILEWKTTLRAIKQESQKVENRIDFNNYRNYELAAHYKELNVFKNFKDTSILWATKWSSNFGNWTWALGFTLLSGLFWYSILYRIENSSTLNFQKLNDFFVGAFRFFLVTDFYNPLETDRTYLENGWSWLIFILGKIFIAFGIYEMIQSFRKFKS